MQSGKFFSDEILRELGVLKDSSPQALVNEESQVDEAPLGFGAGLAARLGTMMPGQSTRAQARGKLESGKVANNLYQNYYQWLGRNNLQPDEKTIIDFLSANKMPTGNAQAVLKQSQPNPQQTSQTPPQKSATVQKGQFNAPANTPIPQTKSSPFAKKPSQQATTATPSTPYPRTGTPASSLSPPSPTAVIIIIIMLVSSLILCVSLWMTTDAQTGYSIGWSATSIAKRRKGS